ncbi:MAG: FAD-dependent oxidoreductase [Firmicutes bacterium]|nr:FAD-dependent oxidoreductase [Bacillota bacterium]
MSPKIVIIGGVAAGTKTAARARRRSPDAEIIIIEKDKYISYAGCGMPFYLSGQVKEFNQLFMTSYGVVRNEEYFESERGITVLTGTEAVAIDRAGKKVEVVNLVTGERSFIEYDKLVLATGSTPFVPPIEGIGLKGVYRLNHPEDALAIKEAIDVGAGEAVVIGAGLIGMEAVDALLRVKIFPTVVELKDQIFPGLLDPELAEVLKLRLEEGGIEFQLGRKVLKIEGDGEGKVAAVITDQGRLETEMVVVAVGVRPNVKLAKEAGLAIGETGAIAVNEYLETSDPDIYAVGDCVENTHLVSGRKVYVPLASTANRQGRVAGDNVTGGRSKFKGILGTAVAEVMNFNIGRTGLSEEQAVALGYDVIASLNPTFDATHYHPKHGKIFLKVIADRKTGRVLGAQGFGPGDVAKRIDVFAAALTFGATLEDVYGIDTGYAPPFNTPIDPVHHSVNIIRNKIEGLAEGIRPVQVKEKMDRGEDFIFLDVRTEQQFNHRHIDDGRVVLIPLGELRKRVDELPRDKEIITSCVLGVRAYEALRILKGAGFQNVKYMEGSLEAWPYELE